MPCKASIWRHQDLTQQPVVQFFVYSQFGKASFRHEQKKKDFLGLVLARSDRNSEFGMHTQRVVALAFPAFLLIFSRYDSEVLRDELDRIMLNYNMNCKARGEERVAAEVSEYSLKL